MKLSKNSDRVPILVSVRSHYEAALASHSGADFIDAKEPKIGALGKLPVDEIKRIILSLGDISFNGVITATYGDNVEKRINFKTKSFESYFYLGLDAVKIGFDGRGLPSTKKAFTELSLVYENLLTHLRQIEIQNKITKLIPVLMVDNGLNTDLLDFIMDSQVSDSLFGFMIDTKSKENNNLFDLINITELKKLFKKLDSYNLPYGVAGSLDESNSEIVKQIRPFWAGYRGGVCNGNRKGNLSSRKIKLIIKSLKTQ